MLNPWFLLGSIAFVASFSISLLMNHDWGSAIVMGLAGLSIAWGTAATVNWYRNRSTDSRSAALKHQIRTLQHHRVIEQRTLLELEAETERVAQSLALMQGDLRSRRTEMSPDRGVSWNLMATEVVESSIHPPPVGMTVAVPAKGAEAELRQFLAEAAATKQKITASLNNLQTELNQLNAQTAENRQFRDQLVQEINHLSQQKQTLVANTNRLQADVKDLEQCRDELDQYISYVETKKQELETGANPLQKALKQLQAQVTALQTELQQLETQVSDRLHEKTALDQTIASLKQQQKNAQVAQDLLQKVENQLSDRRPEKEALGKQIIQLQTQKTALQTSSAQPDRFIPKDASTKNTLSKPNSKKLISSTKIVSSDNENGAITAPKPAVSSNPSKSAPLQKQEDIADALSDPWTNFMVQLLDYEFQALRAIAQESNPLRTLNAIADESFTSLDELLDSINRQAQDIIGESVVNCRSGFAPPEIAREHQKTIKKMIETYEYLTE
ncbi:MAG: hypothetical protein DCF22_02575 [Leptolyngbya sp.]|nr:MAG: hypothetical protein DCF22_02575 [Leptolyngbya sp.]